MNDSEQFKRKRKLIEFITALSGFLGIIVAVMTPNRQNAAYFSFFLVVMIVASTLAYSKLLSEEEFDRVAGLSYVIDISLIAGSFSVMLTIALASSLVQFLAESPLNGTTGFVIYGIVVLLFYTLFHFTIISELRIEKPASANHPG